MSSRTDKRASARRAIKGWVLACVLAAVLTLAVPVQQAWAGFFTGAYLTDMAGNPIDASNPIDINKLTEGIMVHLGSDADSPEIYRNYESGVHPVGTNVGVRDFQTGISLKMGEFGISSHIQELPNNKVAGYWVFSVFHPQPHKQYRLFLGIGKSPIGSSEHRPEYGYFETFTANISTKAGEDGTGDGGDASDGGASESGAGAQGGTGTGESHNTSPDAGAQGGQQNTSPIAGNDTPVPDTGIATDATANPSAQKATGLGAQSAQGSFQSDATGAPTRAATPSGLEATASPVREAAAGTIASTTDPAPGEADQPNTARQVTGAQLASMGTVRTLSGAPDATEPLEDLEQQFQQMQEVLSVTGYPWLWILLMASIVLALPVGVLARSGAGRICRHLPTRLKH